MDSWLDEPGAASDTGTMLALAAGMACASAERRFAPVPEPFQRFIGSGAATISTLQPARSGTVFLEIRETSQLWERVRCPKETCTCDASCYDHTEALTWRHLNIFQHRCEITCRLPRGKCQKCGHIF
ncbi:MAG TPA: hypothetical protein VH280_14125, partial [Verrucomicrobiae bacterium]|nr:hypothetical protein [Verrucomicrobiae bacterium]